MKHFFSYILSFVSLFALASSSALAQELNCKVKVIHTQVQGTNTSVFETLETAITEFMNNRTWTELQFKEHERIDCTMNLTIKAWDQATESFKGELLFQLSRPVYNSAYNSTVFSMNDKNFNFTYKSNKFFSFS